MIKFTRHRLYAAVAGTLLFLLGFAGFAFRPAFDIPLSYLFGALVLGFWGVVVSFSET